MAIKLGDYVQSHQEEEQGQGQTVHKLQIATFWDIYIYIYFSTGIDILFNKGLNYFSVS